MNVNVTMSYDSAIKRLIAKEGGKEEAEKKVKEFFGKINDLRKDFQTSVESLCRENIEICALSELAIVFGMAMSGDSCSAMLIGEDSFVTKELKHLKKRSKEKF